MGKQKSKGFRIYFFFLFFLIKQIIYTYKITVTDEIQILGRGNSYFRGKKEHKIL